jgi:predicted nuclease with TOPRIM domain
MTKSGEGNLTSLWNTLLSARDRISELEKENTELKDSLDFYKSRCESLQEQQSNMRDPERTIVCDILANGKLLYADLAGDRYVRKEDTTDRSPCWDCACMREYFPGCQQNCGISRPPRYKR